MALSNINAMVLLQSADFTRRAADLTPGLDWQDRGFARNAATQYEGLAAGALEDGLTNKEFTTLTGGMSTLNKAMKDGDITPAERKKIQRQLKQAKKLVNGVQCSNNAPRGAMGAR